MSSADLSYSDAPKPLTQRERDLVKRIFSDWFEVPGEWKGSLRSYLESDPPVLGKAALGVSAPSYGTALPANPTSGQEAILVDNVANPTYQWRFRYNALSTSPYKWEFIGGAPATAYVDPLEAVNTAVGTYAELATPGPLVTLPRAGEYEITFYMWGHINTANNWLGLSGAIAINSVGTWVNPIVQTFLALQPTAGIQMCTSAAAARCVIPAGSILRPGYAITSSSSTSGVPQIGRRKLVVTPVRVS